MKIQQIKVENMTSSGGNKIPNQFIVTVENEKGLFIYFQSYYSIIVMIHNGAKFIDENKWDYSRTTGKYRNQFLGENKAETQRKIDSGEYILADLNQ